MTRSYTLKKEIARTYYLEDYGQLNYAAMYQVYDKDELTGQFFSHTNVCFFAYDNEDYRIDIRRRLIKEDAYTIVNQATGNKEGSFLMKSWRSNGEAIGQLFFQNQLYHCRQLFPDNSSIFWGSSSSDQFTIEITGPDTLITYSAVFLPTKQTEIPYDDLDGVIALQGNNLPVLFAGLLFLEFIFYEIRNTD